MKKIYSVYCDESCHLPNDNQPIMVIGSVWCEYNLVKEVNNAIRKIAGQYDLSPKFEIKWTKVSAGKKQFYLDLVDFFFKTKGLHFRAVVVPNKKELKPDYFNLSHDDFYYSIYYLLLYRMNAANAYSIYIDIKDTCSNKKVIALEDRLRKKLYDDKKEVLVKLQQIRSHEVPLLQLADLLIGAVSYANRNLKTSSAKKDIVEKISEISKHELTKSTPISDKKFNILVWKSQEV